MFPSFSVVISRHRGFRIAPLHIQHIRPFSDILDEEAADQAHVAVPKLPENQAEAAQQRTDSLYTMLAVL